MKCSHCGAEIEEGEKYCGNCGQLLSTVAGIANQGNQESRAANRSAAVPALKQGMGAGTGSIMLVSRSGKPILRGYKLIILAILLILLACLGLTTVFNWIYSLIWDIFTFF